MSTYEDLPKLYRKGLEGSLKPKQLEEYKTNPTWMEALAQRGEEVRISLGILEAIAQEREDGIPWGYQIEALQHVLISVLRQKRIENKDKQEVVAYLLFQLMIQYPIEKLPETLKKLSKQSRKALGMAYTWTEQTRQGTDIIKECLGEETSKPEDLPKILRQFVATADKKDLRRINMVEESQSIKNHLITLRAIANEEDNIPWSDQVDALGDVLSMILNGQPNTKEKQTAYETLAVMFCIGLMEQWSSPKDEERFLEFLFYCKKWWAEYTA